MSLKKLIENNYDDIEALIDSIIKEYRFRKR